MESIEDAISESTGINPIDANGEDELISFGQKSLIDSLMFQAIIPEERKVYLEKRVNFMTFNQASELIEELQDKQVDPINSMGYGQTALKLKLWREI